MRVQTAKSRQPDGWPAGVASPARRALAAAGLTRLEQVARLSATELLKLHGLGPKAVRALRAALAERGLALAGEAETRRVSEDANRQIARRAPAPAGKRR
ncbi:MAG: hypothetical protein KA764_21940 [Anaerolineales bacterium]|nr:hypothetical protein [Anaerolineales bacterium]